MSTQDTGHGMTPEEHAYQINVMLTQETGKRLRVLTQLHHRIADLEKRLAVAEALLAQARRVYFQPAQEVEA